MDPITEVIDRAAALPPALDKLDDALSNCVRVLREEAAWWAAGCPPREETKDAANV